MPGGPDGTPRPPQTGRAEALRDASFLPFCSKLKTIVCTWLCFSRRNNGRINPAHTDGACGSGRQRPDPSKCCSRLGDRGKVNTDKKMTF